MTSSQSLESSSLRSLISKHSNGRTIKIHIIPNSQHEQLYERSGELCLAIHPPAHSNLANRALIRYFKKNVKLNIHIKLGSKSRHKVLETY